MWHVLGNVFTVIIGAGVVNLLFDWWRSQRKEWKDRENKAAWVALQSAIVLERFAIDCLGTLNILREIDHEDERIPDFPELGQFPQDPEGWRCLDRDLAETALGFPAEIALFRGLEPRPTWWGEISRLRENVVQAGHMSALIARDLRAKYRFRPHPFVLKKTSREYEKTFALGEAKLENGPSPEANVIP